MGKLYNLLFWLSQAQIPVTFIHYPLMVRDREYLMDKLCDVLWTDTRVVMREEFTRAFLKAVECS